MNRTLLTVIITALFLFLAVPAFAGIQVEVDREKVSFPDQKPFIDNSRTYVPLRFVSEALGGEVDWKPEKKVATVTRGDKNIEMPAGSKTPTVNGQEKSLDAPAGLKNERTVVPLRFVSEALGAKVEWIGEERLVKITDKNAGKLEEPAEPAGETYNVNGYEVPEETELGIDTSNVDKNPKNYEINITINTYKSEEKIEQQYRDARRILECKFDSEDVDRLLDYARKKKERFDTLDKWFKIDGHKIQVVATGAPQVNISVWAKGVTW